MHKSKILLGAVALLVVGLTACLDRPRNGQFFPGGIRAPIEFIGYLREPGLGVEIIADLPHPSTGSAVIAVAVTQTTPADCDVFDQCWYQFKVSKVVPARFWRDNGGGILRASFRAQAIDPQFDFDIIGFNQGEATDACINSTYPKSGGVSTALACGSAKTVAVFTCSTPPCV